MAIAEGGMSEQFVALVGTGPGERLSVFGPFGDERLAREFVVEHIAYAYSHHATRPRYSVLMLNPPG